MPQMARATRSRHRAWHVCYEEWTAHCKSNTVPTPLVYSLTLEILKWPTQRSQISKSIFWFLAVRWKGNYTGQKNALALTPFGSFNICARFKDVCSSHVNSKRVHFCQWRICPRACLCFHTKYSPTLASVLGLFFNKPRHSWTSWLKISDSH